MAIGDPYVTLEELKGRLGITDSQDNDRLADLVDGASREVEDHCERQFNQASAATARSFAARSAGLVRVHDFWTLDGFSLAVDVTGSGVYGDPWMETRYRVGPDDGVSPSGVPGWPYTWVRTRSGAWGFPLDPQGVSRVQVTAKWGWTSVPKPVKEATFIIAAASWKLADAPLGVAGFGEYGVIRVRDNPMAAAKLKVYRRNPMKVG